MSTNRYTYSNRLIFLQTNSVVYLDGAIIFSRVETCREINIP